MCSVVLNGDGLTLDDFERVAGGVPVAISDQVGERIEKSRAVVDELLAEGHTLYGINTGFGKLSNKRIPADQVVALQRNLILSHSAGVGKPLSRVAVRGIMVLRLNSLLLTTLP